MSKDAKAQVVTITLIVGALIVIVWNQGGFDALGGDNDREHGFFGIGSSRDLEPRDVIYSMLDAARDGNVDEYLECYTSQLERTLIQSSEEMGRDRFSRFLMDRNRDIKGIAMNAPVESGEETEVRVEYVYADRNEVQEFYLVQLDDSWKISRVSDIRRVETPVPYGTPVY